MTKHHKNKPGGQTKPLEERAVHRVGVNLTHEEHAKVEQIANTFRISKSEVLRRTLERARLNPPLPIEHKQLVSDVGRIGHNINQVARGLNSLHARLDVSEKYRVEHDLGMKTLLSQAEEASRVAQEALEELRVIRAILMDKWDGVRGPQGGGET